MFLIKHKHKGKLKTKMKENLNGLERTSVMDF